MPILRGLLVLLMVSASALVAAPLVGAQPSTHPSLFSPVTQANDVQAAAATQNIGVLRSRHVTIDVAALKTADAPTRATADLAKTLILNLFDNVSVTAVQDRLDRSGPKSFVWVGHVDGNSDAQVHLSVVDDVVAGTVNMANGDYYTIVPVSNGVHEVRKMDRSVFPDEVQQDVHGPGTAPHVHTPLGNVKASTRDTATGDDGSSIDIMIVYTAAARAAAGGTSAINALINLSVSSMNTAYTDSAVVPRVNLVHAEEVAYTESGFLQTDLTRVADPNDGQLDNVPVLRNTYGADLVSLWVETGEATACGIADMILGGDVSTPLSTASAPFGYQVVKRTCAVDNFSDQHEFGHLMGARHDWFVDPTDNSPYTYNHGFYSGSGSTGFRTIMAYANGCNGCPRINRFSNPNQSFNGVTLGVPEGSFQPTNNAKTLNNTASIVSNFRAHISTGGAPPTPVLNSPSGTIGTGNPAFSWGAAGTGGTLATWYHLYVSGPSGAVLDQWYTAAATGCASGGTCSITPGLALANAGYTWWVLAWNSTGSSAWSTGMGFTVSAVTAVRPPAPSLSSPSGTIGSLSPTFTWQAAGSGASLATWYRFYLSGPTGTTDQWYTASAVGCGAGGTCSLASPISLMSGNYTWWVLGWDTAGSGPWSSGMAFTVAAPSAPPTPVLISPSGTLGSNPTFTWQASGSQGSNNLATWYHLYNSGPSGVFSQWYTAAQVGCVSGVTTCSITPALTLAPGNYTWWVLAWNSAGSSAWSAGMSYTEAAGAWSTLFLTGTLEGWEQITGSWAVVSNTWLHTTGVPLSGASVSHTGDTTGFDYEALLWRYGCDFCANRIMVRGTPFPLHDTNQWADSYFFQYERSGSYSVFKSVNGVTSAIQSWTVSSAINQGDAWNDLKVSVRGSTLSFTINNVVVWTGTDTSLTSGVEGIGMYSDGTATDSLYVNWATFSPASGADAANSAPTVSKEQQALNSAAGRSDGGTAVDRAPATHGRVGATVVGTGKVNDAKSLASPPR